MADLAKQMLTSQRSEVSQAQRVACYVILVVIVMAQLGAGIFTILLANQRGATGSAAFAIPALVPFTLLALDAGLRIRRLRRAQEAESAFDADVATPPGPEDQTGR